MTDPLGMTETAFLMSDEQRANAVIVHASGHPDTSDDFNVGPNYKWGYGLLLNTEDVPGRRQAWSGAWAGLLNTHFWVDRSAGITGAIYTQFLPFVTPEAMQMYVDFETALYATR